MNKDIIIAENNDTFHRLASAIELFENQNFNSVPFKGSWTAAQVVEHILLSATGFVQVINAEVKPAERAIDELVPQIKSIFLNFGTKMQSPDFILPPLKDYDREAQLTAVKKVAGDLEKSIATLDLNQTCVSFQLPGMGFLTRYEAIYFVIYHTQRHVHQLEEIHRFLKLA